MFDKRVSRVSFIGEFPSFPRRMSRVTDPDGRNSGSWHEWTANAVENVYTNNVYVASLYMLGATFVLALILLLTPNAVMDFLRVNMLVIIAERVTIVCSIVSFILLRPHFNFTVDLIPLVLLVVSTTIELSSACKGARAGSYSVAFLLCSTLVVGVNQGALASKPNLILLAGMTVIIFLLVVDLNLITFIVGSTHAVDLYIYSLSTALAVLNIMGLSVLIGDSTSHPFEINDMVSCGSFMYLMIIFLFANILLFTETLRQM